MKKTMLYFADIDYKFILATKDVEGLEDGVLIHCEQSIEKYLKHLLRQEQGVLDKTSEITRISSKLKDLYPKLSGHINLIKFLEDIYTTLTYDVYSYNPLTKEQYECYINQSIELIEYLRDICKVTK